MLGWWFGVVFFSFQYKATDMVIPGNGKLEIIFTPEGGKEQRTTVFEFKNGGGCSMAMYNTDEVSIKLTKWLINNGQCCLMFFPFHIHWHENVD